MTILQALMIMAGARTSLLELLREAGVAAPDLKPKADEWIVALESAADVPNLVRLASLLPSEIANVAQGRVFPKDHPSDAI